MLARDAAQGGIEILLVQRAAQLRFMGGMHVFPGGAVHLDDADPAILSRIAAPARTWPAAQPRVLEDGESAASAALQVHDAVATDRAYALAAIRETCEEVALLLGIAPLAPTQLAQARQLLDPSLALASSTYAAPAIRPADHAPSTTRPADRAPNATSANRSEAAIGTASGHERARPATMLQVLEAIDARLDLSVLVPLSRWITPAGLPIRFDTRFYVARAPSTQDAIVDGTECCSSVWLAPARALAEQRAGRLMLSPPTRSTLEEIAEFSSVNHLLEYAASRVAPCIAHGGARSNAEM